MSQIGLFRARERAPRVTTTPPRAGIKPTAFEVFAGGGLLSLAAEIEGVDVQVHCEQDPSAVATLRHNLDSEVVECDVTALELETDSDGLDLFLGGPPCQPWSRAAAIQGSLGANDHRNLWGEMTRLVEATQPRVVLLENVEDILAAKHRPYLGRPDQGIPLSWWNEMEQLGYTGTIWKLQAADYGTPQNRQRVWMVLWPTGATWGEALSSPPPPTHYDPRKAPVPGLKPWVSAFDRLQSGCCGGFGLVTCEFLGNLDNRCDSCIGGQNFRLAPNEEGGRQLDADQFASYTKLLPSKTGGRERFRIDKQRPVDAGGLMFESPKAGDRGIVGSFLAGARTKHMAKGVVPSRVATIEGAPRLDPTCPLDAHAGALRELTVREAAKLMDVPQWYEFKSSSRARSRAPQYAQVGNGITVNMGRAVIRHAMRALRPSEPLPRPGSIAARQEQRGDAGLWPFAPTDQLCSSYVAPLEDRLVPGRGAGRRRFPGGDPNRPRDTLSPLLTALEDLRSDPESVLGWSPEEPDDAVWTVEELQQVLPRYTDTGGDYAVPTATQLYAALDRAIGWERVSPSSDLTWRVQYA